LITEIGTTTLEKACKEMIETILICLPNAYRCDIYHIGKPPELLTKRITSGVIDEERKKISWGLPAKLKYDPPSKAWMEYRDEPGRPLEAIGWCVEKQKSWTVEDPKNDSRNGRVLTNGAGEESNHMEPVLVRKSDLLLNMYSHQEFPRNVEDEIIWKDSEYLVVAVIKIYFRPNTITIGSHETRVIKKLSRSLGTELLSYQLRKDSLRAMQRLTNDRLSACNILSDSLRNAITKSGLVFSLIKHEIGYLREQWEQAVLEDREEKHAKLEAINELNGLLVMGEDHKGPKNDLNHAQNKFLNLSLPPEKGENWVTMQIEKRWNEFLNVCPQDTDRRKAVSTAIQKLKKSLHFGHDPDILESYQKIPDQLKREWVNLIYNSTDRFDPSTLDQLIETLANSDLDIPSRGKSRKTLIQLKALAETMYQLERNTNFLLRQVLKGEDRRVVETVMHHIQKKYETKPDESAFDGAILNLARSG